jgi:hypothetical protein
MEAESPFYLLAAGIILQAVEDLTGPSQKTRDAAALFLWGPKGSSRLPWLRLKPKSQRL